MKVDSKGQPVAEGTFGLYSGMSAKVIRTFIDPTVDDEDDREAIANGAYRVDMGENGQHTADPSDFVATYDGDHVPAQDGQSVEVGDKILLAEGHAPSHYKGKPVTVRTLYPIGTLKGGTCLSIKEARGGAPDGYWAVEWGAVEKVMEKANVKEEVGDGSGTSDLVNLVDPNIVEEGDWLRFVTDDGKTQTSGVVEDARKSGDHTVVLDRDHIEEGGNSDYTAGARYRIYSKTVIRRIKKADLPGWKTKKDGRPIHVGDTVKVSYKDCAGTWLVVEGHSHKQGAETLLLLALDDASKALVKSYHSGKPPAPDSMHFSLGYIIDVVARATDADQDAFDGEESTSEGSTFNETHNTSDEETQAMSPAPSNKEKSVGKVDVVREGTKLVLPDKMTLRTAIKELQRQAEQEEMDVAIMEIIEGFPLDAAHAFVKALEFKYGWVNALPTPGFFGPQPPVMIGVVVDPDGRTVQIPWGQLGIPGVTGTLSTGIQFKDNKPCFCIGGTVKQRDKATVNEIALLTKEYLRDHSIYKGKAIRVKFPTDPKKFSPLDHQPKFIPTTDVRPEELIFSDGVAKQIAVNIWTPIRALAAVKAARVPLKRGVLLHGHYGVGKTLLASVTARMAVEAGITFMDLVDSNQLPQAVEFGRMLGGMVVIFAEDIDRCDENGERSDAFNEILNTVDGLTSKTDEVMIVYTTNHIERISQAMLRQGRIDKVIEIKEPDEVAAQKLVRLYARHMLKESENLTAVGVLLTGFIPAAIREVVEQSKLAAIERGDFYNITAEDLRVTAENTRDHMELLKPKPKDDRSELEKAADALGKRIALGLDAGYEAGEGAEEQIQRLTRRKAA